MGAPKGSKNALGNKGGGRKSAYQELADATRLHQAFNKGLTLEQIHKTIGLLDALFPRKGKNGKIMKKDMDKLRKIYKKKLNYTDLVLLRAIQNPKVLIALMMKVFPDKFKDESDFTGLADVLAALQSGRVPQPPEEPEE